MKRLLMILSAVFLLVSFLTTTPTFNKALCYAGDSKKQNHDEIKYEREFNVKSGQKIKIDLEAGGNINIKSWDKNLVSVNIVLSGKNAGDVEVDMEETSYGVNVRTEYDGWGRNRKLRQKILFMVPRKFDLDFYTAGGNVNIHGVEGELEGKTMGGNIELKDLKGDLRMETMGGNINMKNLKGILGMKTMGGNIDVDEALNGARVKTMGGNIVVEKAEKFVEVETMGGIIKIKSIDGWVEAKTMGGDIYCRMVGDPDKGDRDVRLTSKGGDIELYVPNVSLLH